MTKESSEAKRQLWTSNEDELLQKLCKDVNQPNWTEIASSFPGRKPKQCRERWINHLSPEIQELPWTLDDDNKLWQLQSQFGNKWSAIAKQFSGRSENSIKNRWYSSINKRITRDCTGKFALADPIKRGRSSKSFHNVPNLSAEFPSMRTFSPMNFADMQQFRSVSMQNPSVFSAWPPNFRYPPGGAQYMPATAQLQEFISVPVPAPQYTPTQRPAQPTGYIPLIHQDSGTGQRTVKLPHITELRHLP